MRRRLLPIAAVALAGLLVGAWLSSGSTAPSTPVRRARPAPATRLSGPATAPGASAVSAPAPPPPADTAPPPLPSHDDDDGAPPLADLLAMGPVRCELDDGEIDDIVVFAHAGDDVLAPALAEGLRRPQLESAMRRPLRWRAVQGSSVEIQAPVGTALLEFRIPGEDGSHGATVSVRWRGDEGVCQSPVPTVPPRRIRLAGRVEGILDGDEVWLAGCAMDGPLADDRFAATVTLPDRPCELFALRRDGLIQARSPTVEIDPAEGDRTDILLRLPDHDVGGIGAPVRPDPDGLRLGPPREDSPAQHAGLGEGDVVLQADGQPLAGLSLPEMVGLVTGEVGTTVELLVRGPDGGEHTVEVQREWIEE